MDSVTEALRNAQLRMAPDREGCDEWEQDCWDELEEAMAENKRLREALKTSNQLIIDVTLFVKSRRGWRDWMKARKDFGREVEALLKGCGE